MIGDIRNRLSAPIKIKLAEDVELTGAVIDYCLTRARQNKECYLLLDRYYNNDTAIQSRRLSDADKPNNRISHAFAKYITKIATAYFMGFGIRYDVKDAGYKAVLDEILDGNMTKIKHFEEAKEMSKQGVSYELLYINPEGKLKTQFFGADEIIPVFSSSSQSFLALALRPYEVTEIGVSRPVQRYVEVYSKLYVERWKQSGKSWMLIERFSHHFSDVPVIVRFNNAEMKGDFEDIIPQIDAYDKAQSDTGNDLDYFTDAYLVLEGLDDLTSTDEDGNELTTAQSAKIMKQNRMLYVPSGCKASFITKDSNDTSSDHYKKRIYKDIFFLAQVPNLTDEEFAGNLSGVAIKYKLFGLEELSIEKETYFTSSETKKIRLITKYINALKNTRYDWKTVALSFDRSAVANTYEIAQIMNMLRDLLSDETLIAMFPEVKDVAAELQRKLKDEARRENKDYPPDEDAGVF